MCSHSVMYRRTSWGCIVGWPEPHGILLDVSNASRELLIVQKYPLTPMDPVYYSGCAATSLNLASMPHAGNRGRRGQHWFMRGATPTTCLARRYSQVCIGFTDLCAHPFVRPYLCGLDILSSVESGMLLQQAREYASQATCTYEDLRAFEVQLRDKFLLVFHAGMQRRSGRNLPRIMWASRRGYTRDVLNEEDIFAFVRQGSCDPPTALRAV